MPGDSSGLIEAHVFCPRATKQTSGWFLFLFLYVLMFSSPSAYRYAWFGLLGFPILFTRGSLGLWSDRLNPARNSRRSGLVLSCSADLRTYHTGKVHTVSYNSTMYVCAGAPVSYHIFVLVCLSNAFCLLSPRLALPPVARLRNRASSIWSCSSLIIQTTDDFHPYSIRLARVAGTCTLIQSLRYRA